MRYGDKAPKSIVARIFAIIWILLGLIIMAIFMANITSALTALSLQLELTDLVGLKVCPNIFCCWDILQFKRAEKQIYRGYYTVARRYEFYVRVARTISPRVSAANECDIVLATRT